MLTRKAKAGPKANRLRDLNTILESRRSELMHDVQHKIRDVRSDGITDRDVLDTAESSEVDTQDDIESALSAEARSPKHACERFRSRCDAETVKTFVK